MNCRSILPIIGFIAISTISFCQDLELAKITVESGPYDRQNVLVCADLSGIPVDLANSELVLIETVSGKESLIESQLDMDNGPKLYWKIQDKLMAGKSKNYSLRKTSDSKKENSGGIEIFDVNGNLVIRSHGKNVLQYNFKEAPLPEGVPAIFNRAGYIHPLWSPKGEVLTRIQPPDHRHHVGLWNPWTHTKFKGKEIDFWNLVAGQGTVKPVTITSKTSNYLFGGFKVIHDHIDLNGVTPQGFEVALKEEWNVRVWNLEDNAWVIDFVSTLNCATDSILTIEAYRYQGFGFRATEKWDDKTAILLTSEDKNKEDGNGTRARWCDVNGISTDGTAGVLFITHPSNYNYPEPIRIWPVGTNEGKENVFFNFNPAMDRDWVLHPGNDYQLKYRMYVYDGKIDKIKSEKMWQDFAYPPIVSVKPNNF